MCYQAGEDIFSYKDMESFAKNFRFNDWHILTTYTAMPYWTARNGSTLLHLAVIHENIDLVKCLLYEGCITTAYDSFGYSPLMIALKSIYKPSSLEAAKLLLAVRASIHARDPTKNEFSPFEIFLAERRKYDKRTMKQIEEILPHILHNIQDSKYDNIILSRLLSKADWPLKYQIAKDMPELMKILIQQGSRNTFTPVMTLAVNARDFENIKLIVHYSYMTGRQALYQKLFSLLTSKKFELWKDIVIRLPGLGINHNEIHEKLHFMLQKISEEDFEKLLSSNIHVVVKEQLGIDIRVSIFGNCRVNAMKLLRHQNFDLNTVGYKGLTGLRIAIQNKLDKNIHFLLDFNVNLEIQDDKRKTALYDCIMNPEYGHLLLIHGANAQHYDLNSRPALDYARLRKSPLASFIIAKLALDHVQGKVMNRTIRDQINNTSDYKRIFQVCYRQLQVLKINEIENSITFYDVLTRKIETLYRHAHYTTMIEKLKSRNKLHPLYCSMLQNKLMCNRILYVFKQHLAKMISKRTGKSISLHHLAVRNISEYLSHRDLKAFNLYSNKHHSKHSVPFESEIQCVQNRSQPLSSLVPSLYNTSNFY